MLIIVFLSSRLLILAPVLTGSGFSENMVSQIIGTLITCFYIKGESKITDFLVNRILVSMGWFTPPFDTLKEQLKNKWNYAIEAFHNDGSIVYFYGVKK